MSQFQDQENRLNYASALECQFSGGDPPHDARELDGLAGTKFITAVTGDTFFLIQAGDFFHSQRLGRAVSNADLTLLAQG